jgi:UDP:flavonoid glycosyltransferase YjiC (YdhE family)
VRAFPWAPHSWIFPRGAATIHHGGIGSTAQALRAGRPQLVVPHAHDQFNNAVRVVRLGVGAMVPRHCLTQSRLTRTLGRLLADAAVNARARDLGTRVAAEDGAVAAAAVLERIAAAPRRDAQSSAAKG